MATWKQVLFCVVILVAAVLAWARFFPGAEATLERWGLDGAVASISRPETGNAARSNNARLQAMVVAAAVGTATINDRLQAIGTGRAKATVTLNPYSAGRLTEFLVGSGSHVEAGQVVARLDSQTEEIALERARAQHEDAVAKVERIRALRSSSTASAVQLTDAELELRNAELSVHEAQLALDRRSVTSPISGVVGILPIEAGNYVTSQTSIATIDDRSSILIDFWVPERFAAAIGIGSRLSATPLANPKDVFEGTVTAIDNRIDDKSRTLWVQATIANPADSLRAGMSFQIVMKFPGDTYLAVSPLAVQWGGDGAFVWAVEDGKARRVPVRIIQRNTETVLVDAAIASGDLVVTEGVQSVRDGGDVMIARSNAARPPDAPAAGS